MFSYQLEVTLKLAFTYASQRHHRQMSLEHLLLALLDDPDAAALLASCQADLKVLRKELSGWMEGQAVMTSEMGMGESQPTLAFQRVIQRAIFQVQAAGDPEVTGVSLLSAMMYEDPEDCHAVHLLNTMKVTRIDLLHAVSQQPKQHDTYIIPPHLERHVEAQMASEATAADDDPIAKYTLNLNQQAQLGMLDPVLCRNDAMERCMQILCRRRKNNPLLIGEAGVGKTAIVEGLATRIVSGDVPETLRRHVIYALDLGALLAGTKYRGDFEKRFKKLLKALNQQPGAVLFIDEIHTIIGTGAASGGTLDTANLIKPMLSRSQLRCLGATTYQEYKAFAQDHALARRFQNVDVPETTVEETVTILKQGLKDRFEKHHRVRYTHGAIQAAVTLSDRYMADRCLPDKAIDVIDEAGAYFSRLRDRKASVTVHKKDIEWMVAKIARIPTNQTTRSDRDKLMYLEQDLKSVVYGQDDAIEALVGAIKMSRSGLRDHQRPIGSFLFTGPTGVGKTEVCLRLAEQLGVTMLRFDMSEYMERHSASQLVGAPAGYVGFEQGGRLTDDIAKHPHAVLLLDEIEKAHPDILNLLLQVMDHGHLTDHQGRTIDCRHLVIIMTSNTGADGLEKTQLGFLESSSSPDMMAAVKQTFTPEFRNRLDAIIAFKPLGEAVIERIVDKFLTELEVQLEAKRVTLSATRAARQWLADHGTDRAMGARPMRRLIDQQVRQRLADELLFGKLSKGGSVYLTTHAKQLKVDVVAKKAALKRASCAS